MEKREVEDLRGLVPCAFVLEQAGFAVDHKESTKRAVKYRRGDDIIIVIHEGKGWFDPLSDAKGDVFRLVERLENVPFVEALDRVATMVGFVPTLPVWRRALSDDKPDLPFSERWHTRRKPWRGSMTWRYLHGERRIPEHIICAAIQQDRLREGPRGSMWAAHTDDAGAVSGWEERGLEWRGFAFGGGKVLFRLGSPTAIRFCITEAAIDAMSLAAIEGLRRDTLYLSTGGGWAPVTNAALRTLAARPDVRLVAATDANPQGEAFVSRLRELASEVACDFERLKPAAEDWNAMLQQSALEA